MENYYQTENRLKRECPKDVDLYIPQWVKMLVELYTSPLKYEVKYGLRDSKE